MGSVYAVQVKYLVSVYTMQVNFWGAPRLYMGNVWGPSRLCRSIFWGTSRLCGRNLGPVYAVQVKFGVPIRYAGELFFGWGLSTLYRWNWGPSTLCRSVFGVCLTSVRGIRCRSALCRSAFGVDLRYAGQFLGSVYAMQVKLFGSV